MCIICNNAGAAIALNRCRASDGNFDGCEMI